LSESYNLGRFDLKLVSKRLASLQWYILGLLSSFRLAQPKQQIRPIRDPRKPNYQLFMIIRSILGQLDLDTEMYQSSFTYILYMTWYYNGYSKVGRPELNIFRISWDVTSLNSTLLTSGFTALHSGGLLHTLHYNP